jgi:hypothetical protein
LGEHDFESAVWAIRHQVDDLPGKAADTDVLINTINHRLLEQRERDGTE